MLLSRVFFMMTLTNSVYSETPWTSYVPVLKRFILTNPIIVVFYRFPHDLEFHQDFPNQQVLSSPKILYKRCPGTRILVLTGLSYAKFGKSFDRNIFRLCPLGTVYYLLNDLQLYYFNLWGLEIFSARNAAMRKGLFQGTSLDLKQWESPVEVYPPPSWTDYNDLKFASIRDIRNGFFFYYASYELVLRFGNYNLAAFFSEHRISDLTPHKCLDCPNVGFDVPIVVAVHKPQKAQPAFTASKYFSDRSVLVLVGAFSLVMSCCIRFSSPNNQFLGSLYITLASMIVCIPLKQLKGGSKLVMTFGLWLFLSQILMSELRSESIQYVSMKPRDTIDKIDGCEEVTHVNNLHLFLAATNVPRFQPKTAAKLLLTYSPVCLYDPLEAKAFLASFEHLYPEAHSYKISSRWRVALRLVETYHFARLENSYMFGHILFRTMICPLRGIVYINHLLEVGLFYGSKLKKYRHIHPEYDVAAVIDHLSTPRFVYWKHQRLAKRIGQNLSTTTATSLTHSYVIALCGYLFASVALVLELLVGSSFISNFWFGFCKCRRDAAREISRQARRVGLKMRRKQLFGNQKIRVKVIRVTPCTSNRLMTIPDDRNF